MVNTQYFSLGDAPTADSLKITDPAALAELDRLGRETKQAEEELSSFKQLQPEIESQLTRHAEILASAPEPYMVIPWGGAKKLDNSTVRARTALEYRISKLIELKKQVEESVKSAADKIEANRSASIKIYESADKALRAKLAEEARLKAEEEARIKAAEEAKIAAETLAARKAAYAKLISHPLLRLGTK